MIIKSKLQRIILICFFCLPWALSNSLIAMEERSKDQSAREKPEGDIYSFLKGRLEHVKRHDPLFFKLIMHNGREVYILGSIHPTHPELLLCQAAFDILRKLSNLAILFLEQEPVYDYWHARLAFPEFNPELAEKGEQKWKLKKFLKRESRSKTWSHFKDIPFYEGGPNLGYITKIDKAFGVMLFCNFAYITYLKRIVPGFEPTLREWKQEERWKEGIKYMQNLGDALNTLRKHPQNIEQFFQGGIDYFDKVIKFDDDIKEGNKDSAWDDILIDYEDAIEGYDYEKYLYAENVLLSTIERNKSWCDELTVYLKDTGDTSDFPPLLIVCGGDHLRGGITKGSKSFLNYLLETNQFNSIERMNKNGKWVSLN